MRKAILRSLSFLACLQLCCSARAEFTNALDFFKSLKGTWNIQSGDRTLAIKMTYELASRDTIVTESFGKELSVFYPAGNDLMMTHFCNAGNQPRFKLKKNSGPATFEFEMTDITNLQGHSKGAHVQRIIYKMTNSKELNLEIVWKRGKEEESEKYVLTRPSSGP